MNKIMIVDDDPAQIFTVEEILKEEGKYKVISANNGRDCLQLLKNNEIPDLMRKLVNFLERIILKNLLKVRI